MRQIVPGIGLLLFFLILAERLTLEAVLVGGAVALFTLWLTRPAPSATSSMAPAATTAEASNIESPPPLSTAAAPPLYALRLWPDWLRFGLVLIREIITANLQVARILLRRDMAVAPSVDTYTTCLREERLIVLLATSITLTPGTMTVDMEGRRLTIHSLNPDNHLALYGSQIEHILSEVERKLHLTEKELHSQEEKTHKVEEKLHG